MKNIDFKSLNTLMRTFLLNNSVSTRKLLLIRSAESQGNLSGTITGWMDVRLSDFGRKQAFTLNQVLVQYQDNINSYHCSDLKRCYDTAFYALGFPTDEQMLKQSKNLREMNFGAKEGLHYDNLPKEEKEKLSDPNYKAEKGESWPEVKKRATDYFRLLPKGNHLVFTHGGLITSYLYDFGIKQMVSNCSVIGVSLNDKANEEDLGGVRKVDFVWEFPYIEEDI